MTAEQPKEHLMSRPQRGPNDQPAKTDEPTTEPPDATPSPTIVVDKAPVVLHKDDEESSDKAP